MCLAYSSGSTCCCYLANIQKYDRKLCEIIQWEKENLRISGTFPTTLEKWRQFPLHMSHSANHRTESHLTALFGKHQVQSLSGSFHNRSSLLIYRLLCTLFNDKISSAHVIWGRMKRTEGCVRWTAKDYTGNCRGLLQTTVYFASRNWENPRTGQDISCPGRVSNREPSNTSRTHYKESVLLL